MGETHNRINRVRLSGELEKHLNEPGYARMLEATAQVRGRNGPNYSECGCTIGQGLDIWDAQFTVPVAVLAGAEASEASLVTFFEWRSEPEGPHDEELARIVGRFFGAEIADRFRAGPDGLALSAKLHLLKTISASEFFTVSASERSFIAGRLEDLRTIQGVEAT